MDQQRFFDDKELPVEFSFEGWKADLNEHATNDEAAQWAIGDLLLTPVDMGEFPDEENWTSAKAKRFRREAVRITKKDWPTLKNYKSIARKFPKHPSDGSPSLRSDTLSYGIHVLVAPFNREDQARLLQKAAKEVADGRKWTVNDMRTLISSERRWNKLPPARSSRKTGEAWEKVTIYLSPENHGLLKIGARVKNLPPGSRAGGPVEDFMLWATFQYIKEHEDFKVAIRIQKKEEDAKRAAKEEKDAAERAKAAEENVRTLAQMEEDLANDVDNKIPSY